MTHEELRKILEKHKKWVLHENGGERADLWGVDLRGVDLRGVDLRDANLRGAYLWGADLRDADLRDADLRDANLRGAYLWGADLRDADLRGAYLRDANLRGAKIDFTKHDIIAEILRRAAKDDIPKLKIAGLILLKREWCWKEFLAMRDGLKKWALTELRKWTKDGYNVPDILKK